MSYRNIKIIISISNKIIALVSSNIKTKTNYQIVMINIIIKHCLIYWSRGHNHF